mgnify:CR=1 FL=1
MKVVIVGGASAAARIRRLDEHAQIIMIERSGYVSYANCGLPYYVGGVIKEQEELTLQTPESFWDRFRIDVRVRQEVTAINPAEKTVTVRALTDESTCTFATTAADKSDANGLLLGAPVTVDYTGKLKDGAAATKIATDPTYAEAVGKWTMPDPIAPEGVMGVEIMVEGAARSINMATLVYTSWELQGEADKILLKGQSLGNGQTIDFTQTGVIAKTADGNYTLTIEGTGTVYTKAKQ